MDRLHSMRVFAKVAELEGFAAAARALDLSPPLVTRLVADLESHLGVRLLNRTTRHVVLTAAGAAYLARTLEALSRVDEAEEAARDASSQVGGELSVLAPPSFATHQLVRRLPEFRRLHPGVTVSLADSTHVKEPDEGQDVSIIVAPEGALSGDFIARRFARTEVIACASPDYLRGRPAPQHPSDLAAHDCLVASSLHQSRLWSFLSADGEPATIEIRPVLSARLVDTLYMAALSGGGITVMPSYVAAEALARGHLVRVLPHWRTNVYEIHAAIISRRYLPTRTRAFVDFLVERFGGGEQDPWLPQAGRPPLPGGGTLRVAA